MTHARPCTRTPHTRGTRRPAESDWRPEMTPALTVKPLLTRGALVAAANWEVVLLQFIAESAFKLLLVVPLVAAAFLVAVVVGGSGLEIAGGDIRQVVALMIAGLSERPLALAAYVLGVLVIVLGGMMLTVLVKGGAVAVLVRADMDAPQVEAPPLRLAVVRRASRFGLERFATGCRSLFRRYLLLGLLLVAVYAVVAVVYAFAVLTSYYVVTDRGPFAGWTLVASAIAIALVLGITVINLLYLLTQLVVASENCSVRVAAVCVSRFLSLEHRRIVVVFAVMLVVVGLATVASILATAGLGFIGFIPIVGLTVLPFQLAAWLARGLIFQYLGLTAFSAYARLYHGTQHSSVNRGTQHASGPAPPAVGSFAPSSSR
jgi:hypothetical protein